MDFGHEALVLEQKNVESVACVSDLVEKHPLGLKHERIAFVRVHRQRRDRFDSLGITLIIALIIDTCIFIQNLAFFLLIRRYINIVIFRQVGLIIAIIFLVMLYKFPDFPCLLDFPNTIEIDLPEDLFLEGADKVQPDDIVLVLALKLKPEPPLIILYTLHRHVQLLQLNKIPDLIIPGHLNNTILQFALVRSILTLLQKHNPIEDLKRLLDHP